MAGIAQLGRQSKSIRHVRQRASSNAPPSHSNPRPVIVVCPNGGRGGQQCIISDDDDGGGWVNCKVLIVLWTEGQTTTVIV